MAVQDNSAYSYISTVITPDGTTHYLKDAEARAAVPVLDTATSTTSTNGITNKAITAYVNSKISSLGSYMEFKGSKTSEANIKAITSAKAGDVWLNSADGSEWVCKETITAAKATAWEKLGYNIDLSSYELKSNLKALAYKDSASGTYKPEGTVSKPTFTGAKMYLSVLARFYEWKFLGTAKNVSTSGKFTPSGTVTAPTISVQTAGSTTTIKNPTSVTVAKTVATAAPGATAPANAVITCAVENETLKLYQLGYTTGASISTSNVTVKTGDAAYKSSQPSFSGTEGSVSTTGLYTPEGTMDLKSYSTDEDIPYMPCEIKISKNETDVDMFHVDFTPEGTISQPTFTGTSKTVTVS